jgi:diguanylate cyclase (GGDEF)-like protein
MDQLKLPPPAPVPVQTELIRANVRQIQRRQWQLWSSAFLITVLLLLGLASFNFPGILTQADGFSRFYFGQTLRGLVGLVLLFNVYSVYQQLQINRIQRQLSNQVEALGKVEVRAEEVYRLAIMDPLTGVYNRGAGEQRLGEEIARSQRHGTPLIALMLDIDGLKGVNDTFGHAAGDELIRRFAELLKRAIRGSDAAVRLGGDEFLVVLPECKLDQVHHVLGRLSAKKIESSGQTIPITFSAGWSNYIPGELPEALLKRADTALYVNKRAGKEESGRRVSRA